MNKWLIALLMGSAVTLAACGSTEEGSGEEANGDGAAEEQASAEEAAPAEEADTTYGVGDTAEVDGVKFTLKSVTTTDERNEFAETEPAMVVKIEYEVENGTEEEIPVGGDLQVYDATGNQVELYPLDGTMGSLQPGKKIQGVDHYGIEQGPIEIYFQPMISFEDPAIFEAEVE